jgi:hypothetical protein
MKYRMFKAGDKYVDVLFTSGDGFAVEAEVHASDIAQALGVDNVEVIEADRDLRSGPMVKLPASGKREPTMEERIAKLEEDIAYLKGVSGATRELSK